MLVFRGYLIEMRQNDTRYRAILSKWQRYFYAFSRLHLDVWLIVGLMFGTATTTATAYTDYRIPELRIRCGCALPTRNIENLRQRPTREERVNGATRRGGGRRRRNAVAPCSISCILKCLIKQRARPYLRRNA